MRQPHTPNANPAVEEIMQAYLKTYMSERQFEELVEKAILDAKAEGGGGSTVEAYDKGFSDGYDSAVAGG